MSYCKNSRFGQIALAAVLTLTLGACGGGSDHSDSSDDSGKTLARSGQVYLQKGVANAQVCVDLQGSGVCSANATTAARTGADGSFQISFRAADSAAAQRFLAAPLIAQIADAAVNYTLSAPAAKTDQINPLTTLVQGHIQRTGGSLADAEQAVAQQLGIEVGHIYQYQDQSTTIEDNARTAALLTEEGLKAGTALQVHAAGDTPDTTARLTSVNFKDEGNYDFYLSSTDASVRGAGQLLWDTNYAGLITGLPRTIANASGIAEFRNDTAYGGRAEYLRTRGNPARVQISSKNKFTGWMSDKQKEILKDDAALFEMALEEIDISNLPMADFVKRMQDYEATARFPIEHSLFTLDAKLLGKAIFPAGSRLYRTLRTRFAVTPQPAATLFVSDGVLGHPNDLPKPTNLLGGFRQPVRLQQSLNGTAWEAMKKELKLS